MANAFEIDIRGQREVMRRLNAAGDAVGGRAFMPALRSAATVVVNDAKKRAPVLTGTLRRSIHQEDAPGQLAVLVGTDLDYARRVEEGFAQRDRLGRRYNQPAQPYLRPALDENVDAIVREFWNSLDDILRKAMR